MSCRRIRSSSRTHHHQTRPMRHADPSARSAGRPPVPKPCRREPGPKHVIVEHLPADPGAFQPGSAAAEAYADALLMRAKRCGMRLSYALSRAAEGAGEAAPGLRRAAEEVALSCAYTTERGLFRRRMRHVCDDGSEPGEGAAGDPRHLWSGHWWLSALVATDLDGMARGLRLTERQAAVWAAYVRGESLAAIAASLGIGLAATHSHLALAQRKARASWMPVYLRVTRGSQRGGRRG